jgi:hypothetical protein
MKETMMLTDLQKRLLEVIDSTKKYFPDYWQSVLKQRCESTHVGSYYTVRPESELENVLREAIVKEDVMPLTSDLVMSGCEAFTFRFGGYVGIKPIKETETYQLLDPKNTGYVDAVSDKVTECTYSLFTTIILGQEDGREVVFMFHPGEPIKPSRIPAEGNIGRTITGKEALEMGFKFAKLI